MTDPSLVVTTTEDGSTVVTEVDDSNPPIDRARLREKYAAPAEPVPTKPSTEARYLGSVCDNW